MIQLALGWNGEEFLPDAVGFNLSYEQLPLHLLVTAYELNELGLDWIRFGQPAEESRFWKLLQGERAEMFGVFSSYELQVLHDWIRGAASTDGRAYAEAAPTGQPRRRATFRALLRNAPSPASQDDGGLLDPDLDILRRQLAGQDAAGRTALLVRAMSPAQHWTPAGLKATRLFWHAATG